MAKVIPEEEKNYNKFPGEHVIVLDDVVTIGDKVFHLIYNHRDGFNQEKLEQRYSDIFAKYDYLVGDWGHEQLRLKGFFSSSRKKMPDELKISHLEDYIKEYMNFGAAFFVLKRMRSAIQKTCTIFFIDDIFKISDSYHRLVPSQCTIFFNILHDTFPFFRLVSTQSLDFYFSPDISVSRIT